jgi:hypothetical protein
MSVKYKFRSRKELMRRSRIAASDAAKNFGRLVNRVCEERATYVVERNGRPVVEIGPADTHRATLRDFAMLFEHAPRLPKEYHRAVEGAVKRANVPRVPDNPWER